MNFINLFLAAVKSVSDLLKGWLGWQAKKQKRKEDAVKDTSKKIFYLLIFALVFQGCSYIYVVSTPMTFDPDDYQDLTAGEVFTVPKDGVYFSDEAASKWIKAKIAEYELRKHGFDKDVE